PSHRYGEPDTNHTGQVRWSYPAAVPIRAGLDVGDRRRLGWVMAALALVTGVLGILVMLAPVIADDPVVSWPPAGQQPRSTVLPLSPYRPLQLTATIPCATLHALDTQPGGGEALRTLPADVGTAAGRPGRLHTDGRSRSRPRVLRPAGLVAHRRALAALLVVAWRRWPGAGSGLVRRRLSWADAVVVAGSLFWVVAGPVNIDD